MSRQSATVDQVREAQEFFKQAVTDHEAKKFNESIEGFKKCAVINPVDENHLKELQKKLKEGGFKLLQESIAFMGCAAVHLNTLVKELTEEQRQEVPIDESLMKAFKDWND